MQQFTETARQRFFALNDIADRRKQITMAIMADYDK
jgi:hypothetical protein